MGSDHCDMAVRLLGGVQSAHAALIAHTGAPEPARRSLGALYEVLSAGLTGLSEDQLLAAPSPDEWSMSEVLEHVAEHDRKYVEFRRLGLDHYIEHGLEHALQLWRLRTPPPPPADAAGGRDGAAPDDA